jgi:hypothetical protein
MTTDPSESRSPFIFVTLVFVLSVPFYWLGESDVLPQGMLPLRLPALTFMVYNPFIAAVALTYWRSGAEGPWRLLKRILHFEKGRAAWYVLALLATSRIARSSLAISPITSRHTTPCPRPGVD